MELADAHTIDDLERMAEARLSAAARGYYAAGADEEITLRANRAAFAKYSLWYRVLADVSAVDTRARVLGAELPSPILVAPTAYHKLATPEGEAATARAATAEGALYVVSTLATMRLEDVMAAASGPKWFQLYVHKDRGFTGALIERAKAAGYGALVVTVDTPLLGRRLADVRHRFALPAGLRMENLVDALPPDLRDGDGSELARYVASRHDASFCWRDLPWLLARAAPLPIVLKGIVRSDDAARAVAEGAAGVIVSNHGGRQLDQAPATIDALPAIVEAVGDRADVLMDGGIRSGTHALIALGLGARAVLVGRPVLWGLAAAGERGARHALAILHAELVRAMALAGCPDLAAARAGLVRRS